MVSLLHSLHGHLFQRISPGDKVELLMVGHLDGLSSILLELASESDHLYQALPWHVPRVVFQQLRLHRKEIDDEGIRPRPEVDSSQIHSGIHKLLHGPIIELTDDVGIHLWRGLVWRGGRTGELMGKLKDQIGTGFHDAKLLQAHHATGVDHPRLATRRRFDGKVG